MEIYFQEPLVEGIFIERLNRFVLICELPSGEREKVHLPDPGRLKDLLISGCRIWLQESKDPKRATKWSAVMVHASELKLYVSLNTQLPNRLILNALQNDELEEFKDWQLVKPEYKVGHSRFDFLLQHKQNEQKLLLEVKSVTMVKNDIGKFPDAVTARGVRHVEELTNLQADGSYQTAVLFVAQRGDIKAIASAPEIDPEFANAMDKAAKKGVQFFGRTCMVTPERITLTGRVPVHAENKKKD
ncbi:DNA/RNA nuclease SfsA [Rossellomorea aquimaris]|uniref:DNA/RNA nuclease SfsA n=1 Tax=Rossellomorea aquimaris TaxID=189382 RepID=UPI0007D05A3F|nr:DNA/RNA nuclease SfsA [Rossellomorea aquimaris]